MTRLLDRLESKGLCKRLRSTDDRRVVNVALTDEGQKAADKVKQGGTINVLPGKYVEGVILDGHDFDGVTIQGMVAKEAKNGDVTYKKAK